MEPGLYDIDHLRQFWTHQRTQAENESTNIIQVMKDEKVLLLEKIHAYEREGADRAGAERRAREALELASAREAEMQVMRNLTLAKDAEIQEYQEKLEELEELQERLRSLERENSELKAAKLMSMFGGSSQQASNPLLGAGLGGNVLSVGQKSSLQLQVDSLKLQLSEKTNDYLRVKEEAERLREQLSDARQGEREES